MFVNTPAHEPLNKHLRDVLTIAHKLGTKLGMHAPLGYANILCTDLSESLLPFYAH